MKFRRINWWFCASIDIPQNNHRIHWEWVFYHWSCFHTSNVWLFSTWTLSGTWKYTLSLHAFTLMCARAVHKYVHVCETNTTLNSAILYSEIQHNWYWWYFSSSSFFLFFGSLIHNNSKMCYNWKTQLNRNWFEKKKRTNSSNTHTKKNLRIFSNQQCNITWNQLSGFVYLCA